MGKRILIPGLVLLLLAAAVSAWLVLNPPGQGNGSGGSAGESGTPVKGVSGGTPDATATAHRQDADATSVRPGSRPVSGDGATGSTNGSTTPGSDDSAKLGSGASSGNAGAGSGGSKPGGSAPGQGAGPSTGSGQARPARSKIIDAPRPPNQTLGNAKPRSRALATGPAKKLEDVSEKLKQDRRGLYAQYFTFTDDPLAELSKLEAKPLAQRDAALVRIDNQVYFPNNEAFADLPVDQRNFAATWDGYLVIPEQGEYWLFLGADNAARLDLDGETVLLNDVQSRYIEVSTVLELAPGLHTLRLEFAQGMLANDDSWRCACNFMYVPKGQQKPVAVPQEMLMVPDWMWSDDAPIITKLSQYEGEIGEEITVFGQALGGGDADNPGGASWVDEHFPPEVYFNGQRATVLSIKRDEVRVRVPIGASSGKLLVARRIFTTKEYVGSGPWRVWVPSASVNFKVTTQFGLLAQWHNLQGLPITGFIEQGSREPDLQRIEGNFYWLDRNSAPVPFASNPLACMWEGSLGIPASNSPEGCLGRSFQIETNGEIRVTLNGETIEPTPPISDGMLTTVRFEIPFGEERKWPLRIEWLAAENVALYRMHWGLSFRRTMTLDGKPTDYMAEEYPDVRDCLLFPPVTPPKPPRIVSVVPLTIAGDEPRTPPFPATAGLISVREGQQFKCNVEVFGDEEVRAAPVTLSIDGHAIECGSGTLIDDSANKRWFRQFVGVLPAGCGEGKLTAKLGLSTSEPFYIDVANKGLIAYLYDLPNPSGYAQFPNILPLTCHTIRKEREIAFDTADSFALPFIAETFAIEWYGAIIIEQDGWYTFTTRTDDGCRVWVNGIEIIDHDNLHAPQEKSSERIRLVAGTYPFRMQFFENNQHEECLLFVSATDLQEKELLTKQVVPKRMFTWEVHDTLPDKIATGKKADGSE